MNPGEDRRDEECRINWCYVVGPTFVPAFVVFIYCLYSNSEPTYSIQEFYVPALNKDANYTTTTNTIFFDINLKNNDKVKGVSYDPINLTFFYYGPNTSLPAVGNYIVPAFYQGINKDTNRRDLVETRGVPWDAAVSLVSNGSRAMFGVVLTTAVRFKFMNNNKSNKYKMVVGAMVEVDYSGENVGEDNIKFMSNKTFMSGGASELERRRTCLGLSLVFTVFIFVLL